MSHPTESPAEADMRERFRPADQQIAVAKAMFAAEPDADVVFVGIALPGKVWGLWDVGQPVRTVPGFWLANRYQETGPLAYRLARDSADSAALTRLGRKGVSAYALIFSDSTWSVFEGSARGQNLEG